MRERHSSYLQHFGFLFSGRISIGSSSLRRNKLLDFFLIEPVGFDFGKVMLDVVA